MKIPFFSFLFFLSFLFFPSQVETLKEKIVSLELTDREKEEGDEDDEEGEGDGDGASDAPALPIEGNPAVDVVNKKKKRKRAKKGKH